MMALNQQKNIIRNCLNNVYEKDTSLFERNQGKGISERCIAFRFAYYLQNEYPNFFVDCDFNSSFEFRPDGTGGFTRRERNGKQFQIQNEDGTSITKGLFVDIIVHKRNYEINNDVVCFELKKWNNNRPDQRDSDYNKLTQLTSIYGYKYGFHLIFGKEKALTRLTIFENGQIIEDNKLVYRNEINRLIQSKLQELNLEEVTAVQAAEWLHEANILRDSSTRRGLPLRRLLRNGEIANSIQRNSRWFIIRGTQE